MLLGCTTLIKHLKITTSYELASQPLRLCYYSDKLLEMSKVPNVEMEEGTTRRALEEGIEVRFALVESSFTSVGKRACIVYLR